MNDINHYEEFTREELVAEYIETFLAGVYLSFEGKLLYKNHMPSDMPKTVEFWKSKDRDRHDMHLEIAHRYHLPYEKVRWLDGVGGNDDLYLSHNKLKPCINKAIRYLEKLEREEIGNEI